MNRKERMYSGQQIEIDKIVAAVHDYMGKCNLLEK